MAQVRMRFRGPVLDTGAHDAVYRRPVWPNAAGEQQMMAHLDIAVDDVDAAVTRAVELGAIEADHQPREGQRVMLDPAGHPFCLFPGPVDQLR